MNYNKPGLLFIASAFLLLASCKKDNNGSGSSTSADDLVKDSAWMYTQDVYLWYKTLPTNFNPRSYSDPNAIMEAIRQYSIEPGFTDPVDRWSFGIKKAEWDDVSSGISGDFGLGIFFNSTNDLRVSYVEPASPAGAAGITRAWRIVSINNDTTINTDDATITRISTAVYSSSSTSFVFVRPDNTDTSITLTAASYQEQPILLDSIYNIGGNKVGYFVYNSFLGNVTAIKSQFNTLFNKFNSEGITDMVVDLRYNGGGYVELQNELANYLVPSAGNGGVMLQEQFNDKLSATEDTTINYLKKGSLNLSRIFFITTKNTASASELLINSLKPYMDVKLVGKPSHGKPVGFFNIGVGDWYIFPVSFRSVNKNGEGNYFNGLQPDANVNDGLDKQWGDVEENCLASALHYISNGAFSRVSSRVDDLKVESGNTKFDARKFKGAVEKRR
ncbi:MAG: S41 family peptidase [Agriterribacter sp.]